MQINIYGADRVFLYYYKKIKNHFVYHHNKTHFLDGKRHDNQYH